MRGLVGVAPFATDLPAPLSIFNAGVLGKVSEKRPGFKLFFSSPTHVIHFFSTPRWVKWLMSFPFSSVSYCSLKFPTSLFFCLPSHVSTNGVLDHSISSVSSIEELSIDSLFMSTQYIFYFTSQVYCALACAYSSSRKPHHSLLYLSVKFLALFSCNIL